MNLHRFTGAISVGVISASVFAQVVPLCCRYLYDWSQDDDPNTPCSGTHAFVCESSSNSATSEDPLAKARQFRLRKAACTDITLSSMGQFAHTSCDIPPTPDSIYVAQLPDGSCCWADDPSPTVSITYQPFSVSRCEGNCYTNPE